LEGGGDIRAWSSKKKLPNYDPKPYMQTNFTWKNSPGKMIMAEAYQRKFESERMKNIPTHEPQEMIPAEVDARLLSSISQTSQPHQYYQPPQYQSDPQSFNSDYSQHRSNSYPQYQSNPQVNNPQYQSNSPSNTRYSQFQTKLVLVTTNQFSNNRCRRILENSK